MLLIRPVSRVGFPFFAGLLFLLLIPGRAAATALPSTISSNTTLTAGASPYTGTGVTVSSGVTLTVEPGTVIKISGLLKVEGTLAVNGTAGAPVTFTSKKDDSVGGDTNGDGSATTPKPADWSGIEFPASAGGASMLAYVNLLYGGAGGTSPRSTVEIKCSCSSAPKISHIYVAHSPSNGINISKGTPSITDSTIEGNASTGIKTTSASPHIENNTIANNSSTGISFSVASGEHASVDINGNVVEGNKSTGISVSAGTGSTHIDSASLGGNVVKGNGGKAIVYETFPNSSESAEFVGNPVPSNITSNTLSGNAMNGIWVAGRVAESATWKDSGYPLVVFNNGLNVGKGSTLTLSPGTVLKDEKRSIFVNGSLHSEGTAEEPVTITSYRDDSVDGDTNGDGEASAPAPGDWRSVEFPGATTTSTLVHTRVLYGGRTVSPFESMIEIKCPCSTPPEFIDSTIGYSAQHGINIHGGAPTIAGSTIEGNTWQGINSTSASPVIEGDTIVDNGTGINFSVSSGAHASVDINNNVVEGNKSTGISVSAGTGSTHIDSASVGNNVLKGNGGKAISYTAFPNSSESAEFTGNPVPPNITSNTLSGNAENGIWVGGRIAESTTWKDSGYPLVVFNNGLNVGTGSTLTLGPGMVVKDEKRSIFVNGALHSEGTAEEPVTITSYRDDSVDGDTNGDGSATAPAPGDWRSIEFPGATITSVLSHTRVLYGGWTVSPFESMLEIQCPCSTPPEIVDSTIGYSAQSGINIHGGSPSIISSTIEGNTWQGINSTSASPLIEGDTIVGNNSGINFSVATGAHASVDINNNVVEGNKSTGISVSAGTGSTHIDSASVGNNVLKGNGGKAISYTAFPNSSESAEFTGNPVPPNITSNTLSGNAENGIWVGGRIAESTTWKDSGYPLVVFNNGLNVGTGSILTLGPGMVVKDEKRSIFVNGALHSEGTAEEPVTITSYRDDSVDGDTNGDGEATEPTLGDWGEIEFPSSENVTLEYLDLRYAETAIDVKYLDSMEIAHSDFVYNKKAIDVAETAENSPELGALSCVPPYLSFVFSVDNWYGKTGYPAPDMDISGAVGAVLPAEYAPLFGAAASLAELDYSLYGTDNTIPFSIYSCPALGIPPTPVTPVILVSTALEPLFPDPEVE